MRFNRFCGFAAAGALLVALLLSNGWAANSGPGDRAKPGDAKEDPQDANDSGPPADGKSVVFILDASGSMINTFSVAKADLQRKLKNLKEGQPFNIVLIEEGKSGAFQKVMAVSSTKTQKAASVFLDKVSTSGAGDTLMAVKAAFKFRPDAVIIYSDFDFPPKEDVAGAIKKLNTQKRPVNTIVLFSKGVETGNASDVAEQIAKESKGEYRSIEIVDVPAKPKPGK